MRTIRFIYKYKLVLIVLLFIMWISVSKSIAGNIVASIVKEKEVSPSSIIYITNSTDIEIHTWEQKKVKHSIEITIEPVDPLKAQELAKQFNFEIQTTLLGNIDLKYDLGIRQMGEFSNNKIKTKKGEFTIVLNSGKVFTVKKISFKFIVYIPQSNELILNSSFSNVSLGNLSNKAKLNLTSVTLKANDVNDIELNASFSNCWFGNVRNALFETKSCEINANSVAKSEIKSGFSKFSLTKVSNLEIYSSTSDVFNIPDLEIIKSQNSSFSNYIIGELRKSMNISSQNGDIIIENVNKDFSQIDISNTFSTITIGTLNTNGFILNTNTEFSDFVMPKDIQLLVSRNKIKNFYKGSRLAKQKINIECTSCNVNLK